ncbi:type II secretion system protein GspG [Winogradskyella sp. PAMC22761]|nr:type II secretion system protein GspG [Winogradskyella sp. PAMC22761]
MKNLLPFITSFFLPGIGQFILKDFKKGGIILASYIISTFLILNLDFLSLIPFWFPHIIIMIWAIFGVYDIIEERDGKKSATRYLAFSLLIVIVLFPITLTLLTTGIFKGAEFVTNEYLNEDRTKTEMNKISTELSLYKNHYGTYPKNYESFVSRKPIWGSWKADSWKNPYKYELIDSLNYKLISAGKDGIYLNEDDIIRRN